MELNEKQIRLCEENSEDFSDLKALFINCTLKKSPQTSNTRGLMDVAKAIMEITSVCQRVIERLYGQSGELNDKGQYAYYGRAGGCIVTGNEDGIKHCGMEILYSLQHLGFTIPP